MTLDEKNHLNTQKMPYSLQEEVFDFVQYHLLKTEQREKHNWNSLSLTTSMHDMDDEPDLYSLLDMRTTFS